MQIPAEKDYFVIHALSTRINSREVHYFTKPGIPDWDRIQASTKLITEHTKLPPDHRVLLLGCENVALAISLADQLQQGILTIFEPSYLAAQLITRSLGSNANHNVSLLDNLYDETIKPQSFDSIIINLPKGRKLAQSWLAHGVFSLKSGGSLFIAGANNLGVQGVIRDAEQLLGPSVVLAYKKGNRLAKFTRKENEISSPGWLLEPGIAPGAWFDFDAQTPVGMIHLYSLPGVFSYDRLDVGTSLLLETVKFTISERVLDLGCGYGVIGLFAAQSGAAHVDLIDSNLLAITATRKNMAYHGVIQSEVLPSDALTAVLDREYSLILTNPPFHSGRAVNYQMAQAFIQQSWQVLQQGGRFCLVANRFIRYDQLMKSVFFNVNCLSQTEKYSVYESIKG